MYEFEINSISEIKQEFWFPYCWLYKSIHSSLKTLKVLQIFQSIYLTVWSELLEYWSQKIEREEEMQGSDSGFLETSQCCMLPTLHSALADATTVPRTSAVKAVA